MADVHDAKTRSKNMAAIKCRNTKPEVYLRKKLHALGFRYKLGDKALPGKPDLVLPKHHAVIFINGCFWHAHGCHMFKIPATRSEWWKHKLFRNKQRDHEQWEELRANGWRVLVVWECAIRGRQKIVESELIDQIAQWLRGENEFCEIISSNEQP
ncbi:very short patch repair endonuclease [Pontibacterium sp.]|uniref:very short patch repair endonuclease n=1 Tax=Pontibacterium sp. TaxID=2036026 RepID=UPI003518214C